MATTTINLGLSLDGLSNVDSTGKATGDVLEWNSVSGNWEAATPSGGGGTPAGSNGEIQFNNSGAFGADSNLVWDNTNKRLGVGTATPTSSIDTIGNITTNSAAGTSTFGTGQIIANSLGNSIGSGFYSQVGTGTGTYGGYGVGYGTTIKWLLGITKANTDTTSFLFLEDGLAANRRMSIVAGGNVGVGSSVPLAKLQTFSTNQLSQMTLGSTNGVGLTVSNTHNYYGLNFGTAVSGDGWIQQGTTTGGGTPYNLSLQASGGRVGIGAISPQARLDVRAQGALSTDIAFRVRNSADNGNLFGIRGNSDYEFPTVSNNGEFNIYQSTIRLFKIGDYSKGSISFGQNSNFSNTLNRATIIGSEITSTGTESFAAGFNSGVSSNGGIAIGIQARADGSDNVIKIGRGNLNSHRGANSIHIGNSGSFTGTWFEADNIFALYFNSNNQSHIAKSNGSFGLLGASTFISNNTNLASSMGNGGNTLVVRNHASVPSTNVADSFQQYSADITAGNAAPHFRTENGNIIKLYRETTGIAAAAFVSNTSLIVDDSATYGGYTMGQVVAALKAQGLLA